ncbi:CST complex subunit STN1 [Takifugu flavidus]|uniref:CST complex subunit STN1 n=1 Tax=Takifugu flavidus TaxID=433684 RepID=A0A5C6MWH6_9TELE|nr:CST complex subunit STN1 [Takifugu flavidus]
MATNKMDPADEPPPLLWGLDPVFSAFAKLYIRDILEMAESTQVPGIYFYNLHPIFKVDILGTVVYKRERDDFFCYGGGKHSDDAEGDFNVAAELEKLQQFQYSQCHLDIGELLRVRGPVKTSRQQREIMASTYYKVNDPMMAVQIEWMMEVPELYRQCYDKPFKLHPDASGEPVMSTLSKATNIIRDFLKQKSVVRFRPYDVLDLLHPLVPEQPRTDSAGEPVAGPSACQQARQLLKEALQILQDEGIVYRKLKSQDEVYQARSSVTIHDKDLLIAIKDIIREDCRREKYAEKGCHLLHILSAVRQRYSLNVSKAALELVLKSLECNSDIVSTSDNYYTMF